MSNILIIKHGSLGDIVQISGVLSDIRQAYNNEKIFVLTTAPYVELLTKCPYVDGILIDRRLPLWNIYYLLKLRKMISKFNFTKVYDLQNSSRTSFYRKYLLDAKNWSSAEIILKKENKKKDFNNEGVLDRFKWQLEKSDIKAQHCLKPDFTWACTNVDQIINKYSGRELILILPFSSPKLSHKQWPYFNNLIKIIKSKHLNFDVVVAPGPNEMESVKKFDAISITNNQNPLNIMELAGLIKKSSFVIGNDTGPAHMAAHLGKKGLVLFGYHTSAKKVSIETDNFKALTVDDLNNLSAENVYSNIKSKLEQITR